MACVSYIQFHSSTSSRRGGGGAASEAGRQFFSWWLLGYTLERARARQVLSGYVLDAESQRVFGPRDSHVTHAWTFSFVSCTYGSTPKQSWSLHVACISRLTVNICANLGFNRSLISKTRIIRLHSKMQCFHQIHLSSTPRPAYHEEFSTLHQKSQNRALHTQTGSG